MQHMSLALDMRELAVPLAPPPPPPCSDADGCRRLTGVLSTPCRTWPSFLDDINCQQRNALLYRHEATLQLLGVTYMLLLLLVWLEG
jgi:hypothetical protein